MKDIIKCYVSGRHLSDDETKGIVCFAVPEYGLLFRCSASGTKSELEIISFLSFLRFAEHNRDIFSQKELHIFTDFPQLMYLVNNKAVAQGGMVTVLKQVEKFCKEFQIRVQWIDPGENRAAGSVNDIPAMPTNSNIKIKTLANFDLTPPSPGNLQRSQGPIES